MIKILVVIKTKWVSLTLFTLLVITILSLWPQEKLPSVPGSDKIHHLIAYAVLMFPTALRRPHKWLIFALLFIVYSGVIELVQPYVNRNGEWLDMLVNVMGVVCGLIFAELINRFSPVTHGRSR
jgi:hypothetical protein